MVLTGQFNMFPLVAMPEQYPAQQSRPIIMEIPELGIMILELLNISTESGTEQLMIIYGQIYQTGMGMLTLQVVWIISLSPPDLHIILQLLRLILHLVPVRL